MSSAGFYLFGGIMNIQVKIGGIRFRFDSNFEMMVDESLAPFLCAKEEYGDVNIKVICTEKKAMKPDLKMSGEDLLLEYYHQENQILCMAKGGIGGYLSTTVCDNSFKNLECHLHFIPHGPMKSIRSVLRLIPMCSILQKNNVLFFHASQIDAKGKGIVFTAASGTGKTTQAKLWQRYRDAKIICNDRTLVRNDKTYGYPVDGSEPVRSSEILPLGAVVLLAQNLENEIRRLKPGEALRKLLPQLIIDSWNPESRVAAVDLLIDLINRYPIYLLRCTPDENAVLCLEQQLKKDGVI